MKIYLISSESKARQVGQLLKLNSECVKLHWSKSIKDLPTEVISSLETLESFVEKKVYEVCTEETMVKSLTEEEEMSVIDLLKKIPELRTTLGTGVVMAGEVACCVAEILEKNAGAEILLPAIKSGQNVILF